MTDKPAILIDLNILLDVLQKREPFFETLPVSWQPSTPAVQGICRCPQSHHLVLPDPERQVFREARATITNLLQFIKFAPVDQSAIEQALNLDYRDFEDAVQMISAVQSRRLPRHA